MSQPTFTELFGTGATYNSSTDKFEITKAALEAAGITLASSATAIEILGAITKNAHDWLVDNTDEAVMATSSLEISAPFFRNDLDRTSFIFNLQFLGAYLAPEFDPDDL